MEGLEKGNFMGMWNHGKENNSEGKLLVTDNPGSWGEGQELDRLRVQGFLPL